MAVNASLVQVGLDQIAEVIKQDLQYIEMGLSSAAINLAHTGTQKPVSRVKITNVTRTGSTISATGHFGANDGNCNQGTVASAVDGTQFDVQAGQGTLFQPGQDIQVAGLENTTIQTVSTDTITVSPALTFTPAPSDTVKQILSEATIWGGNTATATVGTGKMYGRVLLDSPFFKESPQGFNIQFDIPTTAA